MNTPEKKFYSIAGMTEAANPFSRDEESYQAFLKELEEKRFPGNTSLIEESVFNSMMADRCQPDCLSALLANILAEYTRLGFAVEVLQLEPSAAAEPATETES